MQHWINETAPKRNFSSQATLKGSHKLGNSISHPRFKRQAAIGLVAFSLLTALPSVASAVEIAWVGARAGTGGLGAEVGVRIVPTIVVRGIVQNYEADYNETISGIAYTGTGSLGSFGAQVDFRPPVLPFYATAGIFSNQNKFDFTATPTGTVNIGGANYAGSQIGTLTSKTNFDDVAYFGGLGLKLGLGPIEAALEGGIYYQGDPVVAFSASGPLATNPAFQADLEREKAKIIDELDQAKYWPMVTLHARWKF
jgi:hypothetical protein